MMSNIEIMKKKLRLKKMDAHADELEIQKLLLLEKVEKIDGEIKIAQEQIEELKLEIGENK